MKNSSNSYDFSLHHLILLMIALLASMVFFVDSDTILIIGALIYFSTCIVVVWVFFKQEYIQEQIERERKLTQTPKALLVSSKNSILLGYDQSLETKIYLPDQLRKRHMHILGATGSGKTESVILNLIQQDIKRSLGCIILDAKGDDSFVTYLKKWVCPDKLKIFDLSEALSHAFNPLKNGSTLEASQRLFGALNWSEEYYQSKALHCLQNLFIANYEATGTNPTLWELSQFLEHPHNLASLLKISLKVAETEWKELSGLRDQIHTLTLGHLKPLLSPNISEPSIELGSAFEGSVIYFRLQSLLSPKLTSSVGKLIINNLNFLAGQTHRTNSSIGNSIVPIYLDEFASFVCPEFADLISKARSAGFALHFSHQSIGDLMDESKGYLNQIMDNSGTKIVMRINDPDTAEYMARTYGTKIYHKITQRITNSENESSVEIIGEGSQREAHQFRSPPDLFKRLKTGEGSVLISHGMDSYDEGSQVFKLKFNRIS